ncbi:DUF2304 domain-containing protein [bacterium]|nr:DUF2304 domain-containing protein [bacterium]
MSPIKLLLLTLLVCMFLAYLRIFRSQIFDRILVLIFLLVCVTFVAFPNLTTQIAIVVGVGRGADLLLYLFCLFALFLFLLVYRKIAELQKQITEMARHDALNRAKIVK